MSESSVLSTDVTKEIVRLKHNCGFGYRRIAKALGLSVATVSNRYIRYTRQVTEALASPITLPPSVAYVPGIENNPKYRMVTYVH